MKKILTSLVLSVPLLATPALAETLWSDPFPNVWGETTYNNGNYTQLDPNDLNSSVLWDSTIRDNTTGEYYDCNSLGMCNPRY